MIIICLERKDILALVKRIILRPQFAEHHMEMTKNTVESESGPVDYQYIFKVVVNRYCPIYRAP